MTRFRKPGGQFVEESAAGSPGKSLFPVPCDRVEWLSGVWRKRVLEGRAIEGIGPRGPHSTVQFCERVQAEWGRLSNYAHFQPEQE